jgi:hypothetical protein
MQEHTEVLEWFGPPELNDYVHFSFIAFARVTKPEEACTSES